MEPGNTDKAYIFIREKILAGNYPAGMPLSSKNLSKEVGMSRTPVRDALRQLEAEGLVIIEPRMGARVKSMDLQEFKDLCGLRQAIETHAAGLAARYRTEAELQDIRSALESMRVITEKMVKSRNPQAHLPEMQREEVHFHLAIVTAGRNELLKKEILRLQIVNRVVFILPEKFIDMSTAEYRREAQECHEAIYTAISRNDTSAAKAAMHRSLQDLIDWSVQQMGSHEQSKFYSDVGMAVRQA